MKGSIEGCATITGCALEALAQDVREPRNGQWASSVEVGAQRRRSASPLVLRESLTSPLRVTSVYEGRLVNVVSVGEERFITDRSNV